jgi:hypothetical protein
VLKCSVFEFLVWLCVVVWCVQCVEAGQLERYHEMPISHVLLVQSSLTMGRIDRELNNLSNEVCLVVIRQLCAELYRF